MAKRISEKQKIEMINGFTSGESIEELSKRFNFAKLTITRNLKKKLGEKKYIDIVAKNKSGKKNDQIKEVFSKKNIENSNYGNPVLNSEHDGKNDESFNSEFFEITPIIDQFDDLPQKDLSSISISDIKLPSIVYLIIDKKTELETKLLKEYPDWQFLSDNELNRKTIEIYFDLKIAKRSCNKEQKVIKVPNTDVFRIVAPRLLSYGISRIVSPEKLIAL